MSRTRVWCDGSVYPNKDHYYAVVVDDGTPAGRLLAHEFCGKGTVNDGEYKAVIHALTWALENDLSIDITTDSQLVDRQVSGRYLCRLTRLVAYRNKVRRLLEETGSRLRWRPREVNRAGWFFDAVLKERKKQRGREAAAQRKAFKASDPTSSTRAFKTRKRALEMAT